jgi:hypothetical protein
MNRFPLCHALRMALTLALLLAAAGAFALDFGALINAGGTVKGRDETEGSGRFQAAPWLSLPLNGADLYLSAGISADYQSSRDPENLFIPELFQLELSFKPLETITVRAGRIPYQDPSRFTARGLFDGAALDMDFGKARLEAEAFYTGLIYKKTAEIRANPGDPVNYDAPLDWDNFADTYFAPPKMIAALQGEYRGFVSPRGTLYGGFLGQFDLSRAEEKQHTQFLLLRYALVYKSIDLSAAAALELLPKNGDFSAASAATLEGGWRIPAGLSSRLSLGIRWASGKGPSASAYNPVTSEAQGRVLEPDFSGLMVIRPLYEARLLSSLSAELGGRYFVRTDSLTFTDPGLAGDSSYLVGLELDGAFRWAPFSDLSLSLSGGVFFPKTGKVMKDDEPVRGTVSLGLIFSL